MDTPYSVILTTLDIGTKYLHDAEKVQNNEDYICNIFIALVTLENFIDRQRVIVSYFNPGASQQYAEEKKKVEAQLNEFRTGIANLAQNLEHSRAENALREHGDSFKIAFLSNTKNVKQ